MIVSVIIVNRAPLQISFYLFLEENPCYKSYTTLLWPLLRVSCICIYIKKHTYIVLFRHPASFLLSEHFCIFGPIPFHRCAELVMSRLSRTKSQLLVSDQISFHLIIFQSQMICGYLNTFPISYISNIQSWYSEKCDFKLKAWKEETTMHFISLQIPRMHMDDSDTWNSNWERNNLAFLGIRHVLGKNWIFINKLSQEND